MSNAHTVFSSFSISPIHAFSDNYIWCIHNDQYAWVVDPGDHKPVESFLSDNKLTLSGIIITHHHWDHINGIKHLTEHRDIPVYGPKHSKTPDVSHALNEGDKLTVLGLTLNTLEVPGHTLDHLAYYGVTESGEKILFSGDTLFSAGCGRLFEGTPEQMHASLNQLSQLDESTLVFCTHEYTASNLTFAQATEPNNEEIKTEAKRVSQLDTSSQPSLPSTIAKEKAINPFLRCHLGSVQRSVTEALSITADNLETVDYFAAVRRWKDNF